MRKRPVLLSFLTVFITVIFALYLYLHGPFDPPDTVLGEEHIPIQSSSLTVKGEVIPEYSGEPYYELNGNVAVFGADEMTDRAYEYYSELDRLGRCRYAIASIGKELMPKTDREDIGHVRPSGWYSMTYPFIDNGGSLYNRCHMIAFQLAGENDNEKNLITGTRYFNVEGMFPFEDKVADYVRATGNHVAYKVEPIFVGNELVCRGVVMSARSVEDDGEDIMFNVFIYNVQPGVIINYKNGKSTYDPAYDPRTGEKDVIGDYVINTETKEFHLVTCSYAVSISSSDRRVYSGNRYQLILDECTPCCSCRP